MSERPTFADIISILFASGYVLAYFAGMVAYRETVVVLLGLLVIVAINTRALSGGADE